MKIKHIPRFKSEAEEAKFWANHSPEEFKHELREVKNVKFPRPQKRLISMRIHKEEINSLKKIAHRKGIGYLTLIRMWIVERINRERKVLAHHR